MNEQQTQVERYLKAFESLQKDGFSQDPSWVRKLREAAIARFSDLGFPTARRGNEEWKYTNLGPFSRASFQPRNTVTDQTFCEIELERFIFGESAWSRLVFVDGVYNEEFSSIAALPVGVRIANLREAILMEAGLAEEHLAHYADYETKAFTALNTAFVHDGAFVHIPDETIVEEPIHLLFITTARGEQTVSHPRTLILSGVNSKATIIESYAEEGGGRYFTNAVTEVVLGTGSLMKYYKVQRQGLQAFHIATTQVALGRDSSFSSVQVDLGGGLVRNNLNVLTVGEGASCTLNGIYLVTGSQHVDNQVIVDHAKPHTTSRELYKGVLGGKSRSVFHGSIIVREGAQKVDARQEDKNLLLSDQAEADTKPAFWIYCDDVKCIHGAACGQLNEDALFYLRSRGIDEEDARNLLTRAFVVEILDSIASEPLRTHVDQLAMAKLREI